MGGEREAFEFRPGCLTAPVSLDTARSEAARVAACVDLRDVRLWGVEADLSLVPDEDRHHLSFGIDADIQVQFNHEAGMLVVFGVYTIEVRAVEARSGDLGEDDAEQPEAEDVASIRFNLNALFELEREPDGEPLTESELEAFGQTTGHFALYPYAREFVASLTGRMGLPTLHMPVMRLSLESRTGD